MVVKVTSLTLFKVTLKNTDYTHSVSAVCCIDLHQEKQQLIRLRYKSLSASNRAPAGFQETPRQEIGGGLAARGRKGALFFPQCKATRRALNRRAAAPLPTVK
jgi:hypothetical protein